MLVIFTEPAGAPEPSEGAFHDPPSRQHLEAVNAFVVLDDFQAGAAPRPQGAHPLDQGAGIASVGPDAPQPTEAFPKRGQQQTGAVAVLHVGRMHADQ